MRGRTKRGKNVDVLLNLSNFKLCSPCFDKERSCTDGYTSGDPVYFVRNNRRKPPGILERHSSTTPWMSIAIRVAAIDESYYSGTYQGVGEDV